MRILGIDPGIATTGWAVVDFEKDGIELEDFGVISTKKELSKSQRLHEIYVDLNEIINKYHPEKASVETLIFYNNAKTAMAVGEARGVVLLAIEENAIPLFEFTPLQVKNSISGSGSADKKQVQENVKRICGLDEIPKPDDAADAIAIAICCNDTMNIEEMVIKG